MRVMVVPPCESTKCHPVVDFEMVHLIVCDLYFHFQNKQTKKASRRKPGVNFVSLPSALYIFAWCHVVMLPPWTRNENAASTLNTVTYHLCGLE